MNRIFLYTKQGHNTDAELEYYSSNKLEREMKWSQLYTNICHIFRQEFCTITETNPRYIPKRLPVYVKKTTLLVAELLPL
jgi:hypothetical protein